MILQNIYLSNFFIFYSTVPVRWAKRNAKTTLIIIAVFKATATCLRKLVHSLLVFKNGALILDPCTFNPCNSLYVLKNFVKERLEEYIVILQLSNFRPGIPVCNV
jgi:hypothetical protein